MFLFCYNNDNQNEMNNKFENKRRISSLSVSSESSMTTDAVRLVCEDNAVLDLTSVFLATTKVRTLEGDKKYR